MGGTSVHWRSMVAVLTALCWTAAPSAFAQTIVQNRDEPGRAPYQEEQFGCSTTDCTLTFKTVPKATRRVITHAACDQFVPSGGSPYYTTLQSDIYAEPFIPIVFQYTAPYNSGAGYIYVANVEVLAFFGAGHAPHVTFEGSTPALANAHCNLSGYDVKLP